MEKTVVTRQQLVQELTKSPHRDLGVYAPTARLAAEHDPDFLAHLIAWNEQNGAIRDSKVALPVFQLQSLDAEHKDNAQAHLALLDPRNFVRSLNIARDAKAASEKSFRPLVERYLRYREASFGLWERAVIQHRASIKTLYARWHVKPGGEIFDRSLFKGLPPAGSTLAVIRDLPKMEAKEALGYVLQRKIPFLVAVGALGSKLKDPDAVLALINSMTPSELAGNAKMLEKLGVKSNPALRAAFAAGIQKVAEAKKPEMALKAAKAAEVVGGEIGAKLAAAQEKSIANVKGRWVILGDKSGSMHAAIETAKEVASVLARVAEEAHMIFFDTQPYYANVTGWTLEKIRQESRNVISGGGTLCFVGMEYLRQRGIEIDGVVLVSDGEDGGPQLSVAYWNAYCKQFDKIPTLYFYKVGQGRDGLSQALERSQIDFERFDLTGGVDRYSIPNLVTTMRTQRWSLVDQIMGTPLRTLESVFQPQQKAA